MKLIVGLGNPGKEYENTRHNIGFMILDKYLGTVNYKSKFDGLYYEMNNNGEKIIFLKPQTYMNNSGFCVKKFVQFFKLNLNDIIIVQDDLDIVVGKYKFKTNSSSGGHNGIKSIIDNLGTNSFMRMKIGIKNSNKENVIDFVLGKFEKRELELIQFDILLKSIEDFINKGPEYVMNKYNGSGLDAEKISV